LFQLEKALQVELVSFGIFGIVFLQPALISSALRFWAGKFVNFFRDIALHRDQGLLTLRLNWSPQSSVPSPVDQIRLDHQSVATLRDPP